MSLIILYIIASGSKSSTYCGSLIGNPCLLSNEQTKCHVHSKTHVITVLWQHSDDVVTILSPTSGTSGRLENHVSVPPWFLHSDCV